MKDEQCRWKKPITNWLETIADIEMGNVSPHARECIHCDGYVSICDRYHIKSSGDITGTKAIVDNMNWKGMKDNYQE